MDRRLLEPVDQKAEVTHAHEALGDHVEQKAADNSWSWRVKVLFSVLIFSVPVTEGDFGYGRENPIIRQRHAVGVAAEIVEDMVGGAEGFFGINDPGFFS